MANLNVSKKLTEKASPPMKWGDSYSSLLLGILVVFLGAIAFVFFAQFHHTPPTSTLKLRQEISAAKTVRIPTATPAPKIAAASKSTYTVQAGDDLWDISVREYNSGYKWVDIAKANNLANPGMLFKGQTLVIPQTQTIAQAVPTKTLPTVTYKVLPTQMAQKTLPAMKPTPSNITGDTYVVQHGDNLWNVAVRAYNDGYKWPEIARLNNLSNPGLIHSGNILKLPRGNNG